MDKHQIKFNEKSFCDPEYRVKWQSLSGQYTTEWLTEYEARIKYNEMKNEVLLHTIWAELLYASIDDDAPDDVVVVDTFTRPTAILNGCVMITGTGRAESG